MTSEALTLAFIDAQPAAAARALAEMSPEQAAAFLETVPARYVQRIAAHTSAWVGASILGHMSPIAAAAALRDLRHAEAAAVLRLMPTHLRDPLLMETPAALRHILETTLSFDADAVGAHMTLALIVLGKDETVADARAQARRNPESATELAFIVDEARRFAGVVDAAALLQSADETPLGQLMHSDISSLSPRASLASTLAIEAWRDWAALPVLSKRKQVLGALTRKTVLATETPQSLALADSPSLVELLADAFAASTVQLATLISDRGPARTETEIKP